MIFIACRDLSDVASLWSVLLTHDELWHAVITVFRGTDNVIEFK